MPDFFFARQPILDRAKSVIGYELLFRNSINNSSMLNGNLATLDVLSSALFHTSFKRMIGGRRGFVNFPRELLLGEAIFLFPPEEMVVEISENLVPSDEIIAACRRLKSSNFNIALLGFVQNSLNNPLIKFADFIKVDFLRTSSPERKQIVEALSHLNVSLIATKIETNEDYGDAVDAGYHLFQGYYFSKPSIHSGRRLEPNRIASARLLQAVFKKECNYDEISKIVSGDMSLAYRILKLANSPYFGFRTEISSILQTIVLLGCSGLKKFVSLVAISSTIGNKPSELAISSLARARMGEEIARVIGRSDDGPALFLTGLFSMLDAMLDCTMEEALTDLPIAQEIRAALLGDKCDLRDALDAIIAYERGNWEEFIRAAAAINLPTEQVPSIFESSIEWATNIFQSM